MQVHKQKWVHCVLWLGVCAGPYYFHVWYRKTPKGAWFPRLLFDWGIGEKNCWYILVARRIRQFKQYKYMSKEWSIIIEKPTITHQNFSFGTVVLEAFKMPCVSPFIREAWSMLDARVLHGLPIVSEKK
jgi:hypothetical protein